MSDGLITQNSIIRQTEAEIEKRLPPEARENYTKIVAAGMKYAMAKGANGLMAALRDSKDPITDIVQGAIGIVGVLRRSAKGVMPVPAMVAAGMALVLQGLEFAERMGLLKVTKTEIDQATQMYVEEIMGRLGITPEKIGSLASQVQGIANDPQKMAAIQKDLPQQPQEMTDGA